MTAAEWIESLGVQVTAEGGSLTLAGLSALTPGQAAEVLAYARQNKTQLLEELGGLPAPTSQADLMRRYPRLAPCPIVNGHWVYRGQCCTDCPGRPTCGAWPDGEEFSIQCPAGLAPLAKKRRLQ